MIFVQSTQSPVAAALQSGESPFRRRLPPLDNSAIEAQGRPGADPVSGGYIGWKYCPNNPGHKVLSESEAESAANFQREGRKN